jgi:eukaryotic-like serine/threonine-protein kinase
VADPANVDVGFRPGDVIGGKYRVERLIGAGGMGVVLAAHHIQLDQMVALKLLLPKEFQNPASVARFLREARAAVKIKNEHVARVIDVGELENGLPYMVMEYLEGDDLEAYIRRRGPMPVEQAVDFVLQASEAVAEAHALGIVHRDLKPSNLFCVTRADGQLTIKVLDFGISKVTTLDASATDMTKSNQPMGSPSYMSPEQMQTPRGVDARTDVWALGVVLFELLTARPVFPADSLMELAIKVATAPVPAIRSFRPEVPDGLEMIVCKCLAKDREHRYQNVAELAVALLPFAPKHAWASVERISGVSGAAKLPVSAKTLASEHLPPQSYNEVSAGAVQPFGRTAPETPASRWNVLAWVALAGILVAGVAIVRKGATVPDVSPAWPPPHPTESAAPLAPAPLPSSATPPVMDVAPPPPLSGTPVPRPPPRPQPLRGVPPSSANCTPPYTLDDQGRKHSKPDCYPH